MTPQTAHAPKSSIDIEEEFSALAKEILMLRGRHQEALLRKKHAVEEAVQRAESFRAAEEAVWRQNESYLSEALAYQEELTGVARFSCQFGTFTLQDMPPIVTVSDMNELQKWMGDFLANLMLLHSALPYDRLLKKDFLGVTSPMLTDFYNRTGVLPDGCELSSSRRKPVLQ